MKAHEAQFDEGLTKRARNVACGLRADAGLNASKIRSGDVGGRAALSPETRAKLDARFAQVAAATGHETYADLRAAFHRERRGRCPKE